MSASQNQQGPLHYTLKSVISAPLPALREHTNHTNSSGGQQHFMNGIEHWVEFEREVRNNYDRHRNNYGPTRFDNQNIACRVGASDPFYAESCIIGNEIGIVGRFTHNVGQVMTNVARLLGMQVAFGDWRPPHHTPGSTRNERTVPDIALYGPGEEVRILGEIKSPWTFHISRELTLPTLGSPFRLFTGQLARYMGEERMRYGFMTTYNETIFFERTRHDDGPALRFSSVIQHSTRSEDPRNGSLINCVSVRECMLYFFQLAQTHGWDAPRIPRSTWIYSGSRGQDRSQGMPRKPHDKSGGPGSSKGGGSSIFSGGGKQSTHGQNSGGYIEQSMGDPYAVLRVKWDPEKRNFYYRKPSDPSLFVWAEKWKKEDGKVIVLADGRRRQAEVMPDAPMRMRRK